MNGGIKILPINQTHGDDDKTDLQNALLAPEVCKFELH